MTESGWLGPLVDLAFQTAHHDLRQATPFRIAHAVRAGELHRIQHFKQPREAARVTVVRCSAQEDAVLAQRRQATQHLAQVAVLPQGCGHEVMAFIHNQQIPRKSRQWPGLLLRLGRGMELFLDIRLTQVVVRGHDAVGRAPRIGVWPQFTAHRVGAVAIDHIEVQRKFVPHFIAPLQAQGGRTKDQHALHAPPPQQFGDDQSRFHRFTQANIVSHQQIDARHLECFVERYQLVLFHLNRTKKRRVHVAHMGTIVQGLRKGEQGFPASRSHHGIEVIRIHGVAIEPRQLRTLHRNRVDFPLPDHLVAPRLASILVLDVNEVRGDLICSAPGLDHGDHGGAVADHGEHAGTGVHERVQF